MGVTATYCQLCGLPVNHDHYIPWDGIFRIYNGDPQEGSAAVDFGPEHEWLKRAVAVATHSAQTPAVVRGEIHNGSIDSIDEPINDGFVWDGLDERAALHEVCWHLAGERPRWTLAWEPDASTPIEQFQEQLFDFAELVAAGQGWMLVDPRLESPDGLRNRERIAHLLKRVPS
jgi:hypothetical protein